MNDDVHGNEGMQGSEGMHGDQARGTSRRRVLKGLVVTSGAVWSVPLIVGSASAASSTAGTPSPPTTPTTTTIPPTGDFTTLEVVKTGPGGAFADQEFNFTATVTNTGPITATNVILTDTLPSDGSFVSSQTGGLAVGRTARPRPGRADCAGRLGGGDDRRWKAPSQPDPAHQHRIGRGGQRRQPAGRPHRRRRHRDGRGDRGASRPPAPGCATATTATSPSRASRVAPASLVPCSSGRSCTKFPRPATRSPSRARWCRPT